MRSANRSLSYFTGTHRAAGLELALAVYPFASPIGVGIAGNRSGIGSWRGVRSAMCRVVAPGHALDLLLLVERRMPEKGAPVGPVSRVAKARHLVMSESSAGVQIAGKSPMASGISKTSAARGSEVD